MNTALLLCLAVFSACFGFEVANIIDHLIRGNKEWKYWATQCVFTTIIVGTLIWVLSQGGIE